MSVKIAPWPNGGQHVWIMQADRQTKEKYGPLGKLESKIFS